MISLLDSSSSRVGPALAGVIVWCSFQMYDGYKGAGGLTEYQRKGKERKLYSTASHKQCT